MAAGLASAPQLCCRRCCSPATNALPPISTVQGKGRYHFVSSDGGATYTALATPGALPQPWRRRRQLLRQRRSVLGTRNALPPLLPTPPHPTPQARQWAWVTRSSLTLGRLTGCWPRWVLAMVGAGHGGCWPFLWVGAGLVCVRACWKGVGVGHAGRTQVPGRGAPVVH